MLPGPNARHILIGRDFFGSFLLKIRAKLCAVALQNVANYDIMRNIFPTSNRIMSEIGILPTKTPSEFKQTMAARGWTPDMLAVRWGMSRRRIHQIVADCARPRYYDDAVDNLPIVIIK